MAAPLIPIGVAVARAAAPHVARKVGQKAATKTATTTAKRNIGSTAFRQTASHLARDAAEEGVYRGSEWGINRLQQIGNTNATENGGASANEAKQPRTGGEEQRVADQREPVSRNAPVGASSAFSVWDAFEAVQEKRSTAVGGDSAVAQAASLMTPLKGVHNALTK